MLEDRGRKDKHAIQSLNANKIQLEISENILKDHAISLEDQEIRLIQQLKGTLNVYIFVFKISDCYLKLLPSRRSSKATVTLSKTKQLLHSQ